MKRTLLILIVILAWAALALYSGGAPDSTKNTPADTGAAGAMDSVGRDGLLTGDIEGVIYHCDSSFSVGAVVRLNVMPDTSQIPDFSRNVYYFDSLQLAESKTDTLGRFSFRDVPVGWYQITYYPGRSRKKILEARISEVAPQWRSHPANDTPIAVPPPNYCRDRFLNPPVETLFFKVDINACGSWFLNFLRIAPDSVSIVDAELHTGMAYRLGDLRVWQQRFRAR